ncbi:hypothetical protein MMC17_003972 [Xylographa soralifera]|nr:hypothetical protein [Xylographa soralifera]
MVTGVETAGLVLAAFPLLVSAAEHYREVFEKFQEWYHFRPEFTAFCHAIETQKALFEGNLEELLVPLVISDTEMNALLQDPGGSPWLDLADRLKERLPRSYVQYRVIMDEINIVMGKLLKSQFGIEQKASIAKRQPTTVAKKALVDNTDPPVDTFSVLFTFQARLKAHETAPWKWQQVNVKIEEHIGSNDRALPHVSRLQIDKPLPAIPGTLPAAGASQAASTRRVTFAVAPSVAPCVTNVPESSRANSQEIRDLCSALQHIRRGEQCLGFLLDQQRQRHEIYPLAKAQTTCETGETVILESLLIRQSQPWYPDEHGASPRLTRRKRMSLAATLTSSAIELLNTPWLGRDWNKKDVAFLKARRGSSRPIVVEQPYVSPSHNRTTTPQPPESIPLASMTSAVFSLGVMLLELWFGEAFEDQPFRSQYFGPDGCATDFTDLSAAARWHRQIIGDAGSQLSEAIRSCIFWSFRPQASASAESELREALYTEVLQPLERISRAFDGIEV